MKQAEHRGWVHETSLVPAPRRQSCQAFKCSVRVIRERRGPDRAQTPTPSPGDKPSVRTSPCPGSRLRRLPTPPYVIAAPFVRNQDSSPRLQSMIRSPADLWGLSTPCDYILKGCFTKMTKTGPFSHKLSRI